MPPETAPDTSPQTPPPVVGWFKVYAGVMTGLYVLCLLAGPVLMFVASKASEDEKVGFMIQGVIFMVIGLPLAVACALPFFLPRKPWVWIYDMVIICMGMTSCCFLPFCIPLLIYWIKPATKAWFNRI